MAACPRSTAIGIRVGMPIAQANELANELANQLASKFANGKPSTKPQLYEHDPYLDQQSLQHVANQIQARLCPMVAIESLGKHAWAGRSLHQADSLLCEISGVSHLYGGETGLLKTARDLLAELGLVARMSIAPGVGAAWAMAHYARDIETIIRDDETLDETLTAVRRLSVKSLRISPQTVATLERLGVHSVAQLLSLPRSGLATRLGRDLVQRIQQLLGEIDEPCNAHRAVADHTASLELEYPTTDQRILADRIGRLTGKIKDGLVASHRGALRMACYLILSDHPPLIFEIGLFAPTADHEQLLGLLVGRLESCRLKSTVKQITLSVTLSDRLQTAQPSLFQLSEDADSSSLSGGSSLPRLINSLSSRLGRDAVLQVLPSDDPLPEKAFRLSPLTGQVLHRQPSRRRKSHHRSSTTKFAAAKFTPRRPLDDHRGLSVPTFHPSRSDALRRPLTLLDNPMPLTAIGMSPSSSLPAGFRLGGRLHRVIRSWGPERIETGWWNGPSIRRDYYRVELDSGGWWWVYRRLQKRSPTVVTNTHAAVTRTVVAWMLHGRFS